MKYQIFEPNYKLEGLVKCYWTLQSSADKRIEKQSIIPDGCMEMIFHYNDLYKQYTAKGNSIIQPRCFVIGQLTKPLEIKPTGGTGIFSVRFHPNGFAPFATLSIKEMENTAVPLEKLFGPDGKDIGNKIINAQSVKERIALVEAFLLNRLEHSENIDHIVKSAVATIFTGNGHLNIDELSGQMPSNRRQLERKFYLEIGLSPKQLSKMIRLQAAMKMLLNQEITSLTSLAHENDYYDQSHFIKNFRELVGVTPKEFYGNNLKMTSLFIGD